MTTSKHVERFQTSHARPGERTLAWAPGSLAKHQGTHRGALIATDQRIAFCRKGFFGGEMFEAVEVGAISAVERETSMRGRRIVVRTSSYALEFLPDWRAKSEEDALCMAIDEARARGNR